MADLRPVTEPPPRWRPVPLLRLLRTHGLRDRRVQLLLLGWGGVTLLSVASGLYMLARGWTGIPLTLGGFEIAVTVYPPLVLSTWLVFWLGLEWAFIPAYVATLVIGLQSGMSLAWAGLFALADPIGLAVIAMAYRSVAVRYDLRSWHSLLWFVAVAFIAALAGSGGALIWSAQQGLAMPETLMVWQGWWLGAFLQAMVVTAPGLALVSVAVEREKRTWLGDRPAPAITFHWIVSSIVVWGVVVAGFIWGTTALVRVRLASALSAPGDTALRPLLADGIQAWDLVVGSSLLLILVLMLGGVALAVLWNRAVHDESVRRGAQIRFQAGLLDAVDEAVIAVDLEGRIIFWNAFAERLYGWRASAVLGRRITDVIVSAEETSDAADVLGRLARGESWSAEFPVRGRDGTVFPVRLTTSPIHDDAGALVGTVGVSADISRHRRADEQLRLFAAALEQAKEAVVITTAQLDPPGPEIVYVNAAFEALTGYSAAEALGRTPRILQGPDTDPAVLRRLRETLAAGRSFSGQVVNYRKDGTRFDLEWREISPIRDGGGGIAYFVAIQRDVTRQKAAERALRQSRQTLRELAQRLLAVREEERTTIAREIHDELGQALTALKMDVAWLDSRVQPANVELRERLLAMRDLVDETVGTVRRIATELRPGVLDDLGLVAAIEWQAEEFERRTGVRTTVQLATREPDLDPALATAVFRILQEALTNVARHAGAAEASVSLKEEGGAVILEVADDGRGIPESELTEPSGLGISGMRERAAIWSGQVEITRRAGGGTIVVARIPRQRRSPPGVRL